MNHSIYIIECSNGHYYTGYTTDIERRYREHCQGSTKCKYTRSFPPKRLAATWHFADHSLALKTECAIKRLNRQQKETLVNNPETLSQILNIN